MPVSVEHGIEPVWSRDGKRLCYVSRGLLFAAHVNETGGFQATKQDTLFSFTEKNFVVRPPGRGPSLGFYDVFPNGDLVVFARGTENEDSRSSMVAMLHWQQMLTPKAGSARR